MWYKTRPWSVLSGYVKSPWNYLLLFWENQLWSLLKEAKGKTWYHTISCCFGSIKNSISSTKNPAIMLEWEVSLKSQWQGFIKKAGMHEKLISPILRPSEVPSVKIYGLTQFWPKAVSCSWRFEITADVVWLDTRDLTWQWHLLKIALLFLQRGRCASLNQKWQRWWS